MTWTRLSDDFTDRPEQLEVSRSARLLHIEAMVWSNRMLTDGRVPANVLARISDGDVHADAAELEKAGIWQRADDGDAWQLDWTDQDAADDVKARQQHRAETQKRYRDRKGRHERGDHSMCSAKFCKSVTNNVTDNATNNVSGNETPSRPVPSRPDPKEGQGQGQDDAGARSARAPRAPRVLSEAEVNNTPDLSPWDVVVALTEGSENSSDEENNGDHAEVYAEPVSEHNADGTYPEDAYDDAVHRFRIAAANIVDRLHPSIHDLAVKHRCQHNQDARCEVKYRNLDPALVLNVPLAVGQVRHRQVVDWLRHELDADEQPDAEPLTRPERDEPAEQPAHDGDTQAPEDCAECARPKPARDMLWHSPACRERHAPRHEPDKSEEQPALVNDSHTAEAPPVKDPPPTEDTPPEHTCPDCHHPVEPGTTRHFRCYLNALEDPA